MRAREPDPIDAVHGVARPQQLAELGVDVGTKVTTPGVDVLAEQRDLPDAGIRELRDLGEDVPWPPTLLTAANSGDDAVRARGVASHRNLHPGLEAPLAVDRKVRCEVLVRPEPSTIDRVATRRDPVAEMRNRARPESDIDERIPLEDAFALRFGVAASDSDDEIGPLALHRAGIPQVRGEPLIRLLPDGARVEDDDVGVLRRRCLTQTERLEHALDALGVVGVHLTAERRDVVPPHRVGRVARQGYGAHSGSSWSPSASAHASRCSTTRP